MVTSSGLEWQSAQLSAFFSLATVTLSILSPATCSILVARRSLLPAAQPAEWNRDFSYMGWPMTSVYPDADTNSRLLPHLAKPRRVNWHVATAGVAVGNTTLACVSPVSHKHTEPRTQLLLNSMQMASLCRPGTASIWLTHIHFNTTDLQLRKLKTLAVILAGLAQIQILKNLRIMHPVAHKSLLSGDMTRNYLPLNRTYHC